MTDFVESEHRAPPAECFHASKHHAMEIDISAYRWDVEPECWRGESRDAKPCHELVIAPHAGEPSAAVAA